MDVRSGLFAWSVCRSGARIRPVIFVGNAAEVNPPVLAVQISLVSTKDLEPKAKWSICVVEVGWRPKP